MEQGFLQYNHDAVSRTLLCQIHQGEEWWWAALADSPMTSYWLFVCSTLFSSFTMCPFKLVKLLCTLGLFSLVGKACTLGSVGVLFSNIYGPALVCVWGRCHFGYESRSVNDVWFWVLGEQELRKVPFQANIFFLYVYGRLAHETWAAGKNRYSIMPKLHYLSHVALQLRQQSDLADWCQNPLGCSVQLQEDFIGRPSRASRRVNVRQLHRNVIHRCLILAHLALQRSDGDQRGWDCFS